MFKKLKIPYLNIIPVALILFVLFKIVNNANISFNGITTLLYSCIAYFVWGFVFAYLLNPMMVFFEGLIAKTSDSKKTKLIKRGGTIAFIYLILIGVLALFIIAILPTIRSGISEIMNNIPFYAQRLITYVTDITNSIDPNISSSITETVKGFAETVYNWLNGLLNFSTLQNAVDVVKVPVMGVVRLGFGLVVSVYLLFSKESLILSAKKLLYAVLPKDTAVKITEFASEINRVFLNYLVSKVLQSFIMFIIGLVVLVPLNIPLAPFISFIIAVFNMIPYFGPYIGSVPCILIAWFYAPVKALWVLIYSVGIQIIDNVVVGPKIMSSQVGISPLLVILGVTVGGQIGGVLGMFLGVPVVAVIKLVFYDRFIEKRLTERKINIE